MLCRMLALGVADGRVMLVDEATGEVKWAVQAHAAGNKWKTLVAMSPSGRFVASVGGGDESWTLWDAANGAERMAGARHDGTGACTCQVDELGHRVVQEGCPIVAHTAEVNALAFSPCGQTLATGDDDGEIILWKGRAGAQMQGVAEVVHSFAFSADGARMAFGVGDGSINVWDAWGSALLRTWEEEDEVTWVQFSPVNNSIVATVSFETITVWDVVFF